MSGTVSSLVAALMLAQVVPSLGPPDPRIRFVAFNPDQVVIVSATTGFATVISLGPDERVENIIVGDSTNWQVTASKRGDDVVVKPLPGAATTNMVVTTGSRHFVFQLQLSGEGASPYVLRFNYPDAPATRLEAASQIATFKFSGARSLVPLAMTDDGTRTRIRWGRDTQLPAVFAIEQNAGEALINGRMEGDTLVVERVAARFVFRRGSARTTAIRRVSDANR